MMNADTVLFVMTGIATLAAVIAAFAAVLSLLPAVFQTLMARRGLKLQGYSSAIQTILDVKESFNEHPETFEKLLYRVPHLRNNIPVGLDHEDFLTIVRVFWRLSYIHSIALRWRELGMRREEKESLEREIAAWLSFPTFREVYVQHFGKLKTLPTSFKRFIDKYYADLDRKQQEKDAQERQLQIQNTQDQKSSSKPIDGVASAGD